MCFMPPTRSQRITVLIVIGLVAWLLHVSLCDWFLGVNERGYRIFAVPRLIGLCAQSGTGPTVASIFGLVVPVALVGLGVYLWLGWRHEERRAGGLCPRCGYDLRGSGGSGRVCPECGWKRQAGT